MPQSHVIDYQIFGDDLQFVEVELDRGETVIAEAGAMVYMESGITFESKMGDGSKVSSGFFDKVLDVGKRVITGESLFMTHFTSNYEGKRHIAFGAPYPGKIIPIDLDEVSGELICQKDSFLCAALGTEVSIAFNKKIGAGLFGGEGFILQKITGPGVVWLEISGDVRDYVLQADEVLKVDPGHIALYEPSVAYDIETVKGAMNVLFSGEGLFLATLKGPGRVWLQSMPISNLAHQISKYIPKKG